MESRIERLERQNKRLKVILIMAIVVGLSLLAMAQGPTMLESLAIFDAHEKPRLVFDVAPDNISGAGPRMRFLDPEGREVILLEGNLVPSLAIGSSDQHRVYVSGGENGYVSRVEVLVESRTIASLP